MISPDDSATSILHVFGDAVFLTNTFGLHVIAKGKHPAQIVDKVEKALPKDENCGCGAILRRSEKAFNH